MPEKMTEEESKVQRAIRAARIAKQKLLEETRNAFALEDDTEVVKVKRPKAEKVTIKVPNQDKQGYGLAGKEDEYQIKKASKEVEIVHNVVMYFSNTAPADIVEMLFGEVYGGYDQEWIARYRQGLHIFWSRLDDGNRQQFVDAAMKKYG